MALFATQQVNSASQRKKMYMHVYIRKCIFHSSETQTNRGECAPINLLFELKMLVSPWQEFTFCDTRQKGYIYNLVCFEVYLRAFTAQPLPLT